MRSEVVVDLFCGAGGTSTGAVLAAERLGKKLDLFALNHWEVAIETHSLNHPGARHLCENIDNVSPRGIFKGKNRIKLLCASPECTNFSKAKGAVPRSEQSRAGAWQVIRWASELYIENIMIENVPEFRNWGPLGVNGKPLESRKGAEFHAWVGALRAIGYNVDWRVVNTANYGDPTTRNRFFLIAKRGRNKRIEWPEHTHTETGGSDFFREYKPWVSAEDVIDWSIKSQSLWERSKPLVDNTIIRIEHGLERFQNDRAFLVMLYGTGKSRSIKKPLPTVTAQGQHIALCEPFYVKYNGRGPGAYSLKKPLATITTKERFALVEPRIQNNDFDIGYRMLHPHELAAAMSFPPEYKFTGTKTEIIKQIGNAVPVRTATALIESLIA